MKNQPLHDLLIKLLEDKKAEDILLIDLKNKVDFAEYFIICSAHSTKHAQGLADYILTEMEKLHIKPIGIEGLETGNWILLDFGALIVHIFYEPIRRIYNLEELWLDHWERILKKDYQKKEGFQSSIKGSPS